MEGKNLRLESLSMDDLTGVINLYPWFGAARMELCERMAALGGSEWGMQQYSDAALYIPSRSKVFGIIRSARKVDYSDKDVETLLKKYISPVQETPAPASEPVPAETGSASAAQESEAASIVAPISRIEIPGYHRTVRPAGGDFFSKEQYESVKREDDNVFSRFKADRSEENGERAWEDPELGFCTETLARIYADQGYFAEAKKIYSRLILRYPEKSAYFASLIENLSQQEN